MPKTERERRPSRYATSGELRDSRLGARPEFETPVPIDLLREELFLRVERLLPGHLLAGVGGHPAHHREQRAGRHALAVVHRLVPPDRGEEPVMLALVHVVLLPAEAPVGLTLDARRWTAADRARAVGAHNVVGIFVVAAFDLAAREKRPHSV